MSDWPETFRKQRRFSMVVSVAVVAYYALGANLKTEAEYSGFVVNIGRPEHFVWGLWIVWGWAFLRYWQQIFARWEPIRNAIFADVHLRRARFTRKAGIRLADKLARAGEFGESLKNGLAKNLELRQWNNNSEWIWRDDAVVAFARTDSGGREFENLQFEFDDETAERIHGSFSMRWSRLKTLWIEFRSWTSALWHLPAIGEYVAPFALALLALAAPLLFPSVIAATETAWPAT